MPTSPAPPEAPAHAGELAEDEVRAEARERLRRGRLVTVVVIAVLVVVVGVVALLGGLRTRTDRLVPVAVGSVVTSGPYEVTLAKAAVSHVTSKDQWDVVVSGTIRTTGATSIDPDVASSGFLYAQSESTREVQPSQSSELGDPDASEQLDNLTPGLPAVPWSVTFTFDRQPGDAVYVAVFDQEYTTPWIFGDEMGWRATPDGSTMTLPVSRGADREY